MMLLIRLTNWTTIFIEIERQWCMLAWVNFLPVLSTIFCPSHWLLSQIAIVDEMVSSGERVINPVAMTIINPRNETSRVMDWTSDPWFENSYCYRLNHLVSAKLWENPLSYYRFRKRKQTFDWLDIFFIETEAVLLQIVNSFTTE